jgi:hypothetical protein
MTRKAGPSKASKTLTKPTYKTLQAIATLYCDAVNKTKLDVADECYIQDLLLGVFDAFFVGKIKGKHLIQVLSKCTDLDGLQIVELIHDINIYKRQHKWEYGPAELLVRRFLKVPGMKVALDLSVKKAKKSV